MNIDEYLRDQYQRYAPIESLALGILLAAILVLFHVCHDIPNTSSRWIIAMLWSLGVGHFLVAALQMHIDVKFGPNPDIEGSGLASNARVAPALTGLIERLVFTAVIGFGAKDVFLPMIAWLTAKMAANWEAKGAQGRSLWMRRRSLMSLVCGLASMGFAYFGGMIANESLFGP